MIFEFGNLKINYRILKKYSFQPLFSGSVTLQPYFRLYSGLQRMSEWSILDLRLFLSKTVQAQSDFMESLCEHPV